MDLPWLCAGGQESHIFLDSTQLQSDAQPSCTSLAENSLSVITGAFPTLISFERNVFKKYIRGNLSVFVQTEGQMPVLWIRGLFLFHFCATLIPATSEIRGRGHLSECTSSQSPLRSLGLSGGARIKNGALRLPVPFPSWEKFMHHFKYLWSSCVPRHCSKYPGILSELNREGKNVFKPLSSNVMTESFNTIKKQ